MGASSKQADKAWPGVRFSFRQHLAPPLLGILIMALVFGLLNFQWVKSQLDYYLSQVKTPTVSAAVPIDDHSRLMISSLGIKAPIIYEESGDNQLITAALRDGVVHYASSALPGQPGNTVIFGHSSGTFWEPGHYKFVFANLDKVESGQLIDLTFRGVRYIYAVTDQQVVEPDQMTVLDNQPGEYTLTLITCAPFGGDSHRLVVRATQLLPDPDLY